jgi:hypothetical protein
MIGQLEQGQILSLAAQGAGAEEIATELGIELALVKLVLRAQGAGNESDRDINDAELALLRKRAFTLCFSEDESVAAKMTMFLIERDKPKLTNPVNGNSITLVNNAIMLAQSEFNKLRNSYSAEPKALSDIPVAQ